MIDWTVIPRWLTPLLIFALRSTDITLATLRTLTVLRGQRLATWLLALAQALVFVIGVSAVIENLDNLWNVIAFAGGFASGGVIGMAIESRVAPGHSLLRVTSSRRGAAIASALRQTGMGVTEIAGSGRSGMVSRLLCYVPRRKLRLAERTALEQDPGAFITVSQVRQLGGGWRA